VEKGAPKIRCVVGGLEGEMERAKGKIGASNDSPNKWHQTNSENKKNAKGRTTYASKITTGGVRKMEQGKHTFRAGRNAVWVCGGTTKPIDRQSPDRNFLKVPQEKNDLKAQFSTM